MKKNLTTFLICILCSTTGFTQQYGWVPLPWVNNTDVIKRIYQSGNEAWILTNDKLYYSPNYPSVQATQLFASSFTFNDMTFVSQGTAEYGWLVGSESMGARTTDASALVWTDMYLSGDLTYSCVSFPNTQVGYGSGSDRRLHKTINGGIDWFDAGVSLSVSSINTLVFLDTLVGYFGGSSPSFRKTTDGGLTWTNAALVTGSIADIHFYDSSHGCVVGVSDILYFHGASWVRTANPSGSTLESVFLVSPMKGWAVGMNGTITHTVDGGATWTNQTSGTNVTLRDVFFTSPTNGYAVGNNGTILHYTQLTGTEEDYMSEISVLDQNYPNPFKETTTIDFILEAPSQVVLEVFSIGGEKICTVANEKKSPGKYSVPFNANDLPAGIYYYRLQTETGTFARKMTLIK